MVMKRPSESSTTLSWQRRRNSAAAAARRFPNCTQIRIQQSNLSNRTTQLQSPKLTKKQRNSPAETSFSEETVQAQSMERAKLDKIERTLKKQKRRSKSVTTGINTNPMRSVIVPKRIKAREIPMKSEAKTAGEEFGGSVEEEDRRMGIGNGGILRTSIIMEQSS